MNFMGVGITEVGVILLVAFLVLGPGRAIETARSVGKVLGDLRRSFGDVTSAMTIESMEEKRALTQKKESELPGVPIRPDFPPKETADISEQSVEARDHSEDKG